MANLTVKQIGALLKIDTYENALTWAHHSEAEATRKYQIVSFDLPCLSSISPNRSDLSSLGYIAEQRSAHQHSYPCMLHCLRVYNRCRSSLVPPSPSSARAFWALSPQPLRCCRSRRNSRKHDEGTRRIRRSSPRTGSSIPSPLSLHPRAKRSQTSELDGLVASFT